jgi:cell division protein FtsB
MARNRKSQSAAIRFGPALKAIVLCLMLGGFGIGYVWQKNQIWELGQQIKQRELKLEKIRHENASLYKNLNTLRSPPQLERKIKELNLGLVPPHPSQVWRLPEPLAEEPIRELESRDLVLENRAPRPGAVP